MRSPPGARNGGRLPWGLVCGALALFGARSVQGALPDGVREGIPVVEVRVVGPSNSDWARIERLIGLVEGEPLREAGLRSAVERLYQLQRFRGVKVSVWTREDGGAVVDFVLDPRLRAARLEVSGADPVGARWVERVLGISRDAYIDERRLPALRRALEAALARRGWREARVIGPLLRAKDDAGRVDVAVHLELGEPTRLRAIRWQGRLPLEARDAELGLSPGDPLDLERVEPALEVLQSKLRGLGYYDAEFGSAEVIALEHVGRGGHADLSIPIDVGPKIETFVKGNRRVSERRIREDFALLKELGTGPGALLEIEEKIRARYERLGYVEATVTTRARTLPDRSRRQIVFEIVEGHPYAVAEIRFPGAKALSEELLRAQVREAVERYLSSSLGRTGVDPMVVSHALRGRPLEGPRDRPSTLPPDASTVYAPRAYRGASDALADLYRSRGFQTAEVEAPQRRYRKQGLLDLEIAVSEGLRWRMGSVALSGNEGIEASTLYEALDLGSEAGGPPLTFEAVEEGRRTLVETYRNQGYAFARVTQELRQMPERGRLGGRFYSARRNLAAICARAEEEGAEECAVETIYRIEEGPKVRIRDVILRGAESTLRAVIEGELASGLRPGAVMTRKALVDTRNNLVRLGIFDRVSVHPSEEERVAAEKDVIIELSERSNQSLTLGVGASTEEGLRVYAGLADRNLWGTALRLQLNVKVNIWVEPLLEVYAEDLRREIAAFYAEVGEDFFGERPLTLFEYEVAAGLSYPRTFLLPPGFSFGLDLIVLRDYDPAFVENNQGVTLLATYEGFDLVSLADGRVRPLNLQLRVALERAQLQCNDGLDDRQDLCSSGVTAGNVGDRLEGQNLYFSVTPRIAWDLRDSPIITEEGAYIELEGEAAAGLDDNSPGYLRLEGRLDGFAAVAPRVTLFTSIRGGRIFPLSTDEIPLNRRFYAGGRSTIRGYPEKTLLPQDVALGSDGLPLSDISTGGLVYAALKLELRVLVSSPVSLAGFLDVGDLWRLADDGQCRVSLWLSECSVDGLENPIIRRIAAGVGAGLRIATPIGPLAVDVGIPVGPRDSTEDWTLHFSVGAF